MTEFPVEACWISQTQEGQTEQVHPETHDDPFFLQHGHNLHSLGSHWNHSQQGVLQGVRKVTIQSYKLLYGFIVLYVIVFVTI